MAKATKGSSEANTGPKSQNLGPRESGYVQNQDPTCDEGATDPSKLQPIVTNDEPQPPRRGRGRPKKAVTTGTPTADVVDESVPTQAPPRKRVRNDVAPAGASDDQPVSKRAKGDDADTSHLPAQRTRAPGTRKPTELTTRDPLPDRKGRNVHPAPIKGIRRTSHEALQQKIRELEEAKRRLTEMNVFEDIQDEAIGEKNPQRLPIAIRKRQRVEIEEDSDGQESFDFNDVDEMSSQSESEEPEPVQETAPKKNTLPPSDFEPKKYQNAGLRKISKPKKAEETFDPYQSGGLNDDDASSTRPVFPRTQGTRPQIRLQPAPKDLKRECCCEIVFQLVQVQQDNGEDHAGPAPAKNKPKKASCSLSIKVRQPTSSWTKWKPQAWKCVRTIHQRPTLDPGFPAFFAFYTSREPFKHFTCDAPEFLETIQATFDTSFSNVGFVLSSTDKVTVAAYKHLKSKKSKLASDVLDGVKPEAVRDYVRWALRPGRPAYYAVPIPEECQGSRKAPGYKPPEGFLESQFIAPVTKKYLNPASNSALSPALSRKNPPKGLYALIAAAVERGFLAHMKSTFVAPPQFNHDNCWGPLEDFFDNIDKVKEECWTAILQFRGVGGVDEGSVSDAGDDGPP
ncbi:hypothetical protein GALMADRAFT_144627 [Galerina marginata CBS 339.88]|uniref:Uncharacterized protein n=1 Tax=Galerina marginata (strain CBS 339.88) TaxID=685588 RepID=A0A067SIL8_GALM3|nr:hypothetical protein GALMADRAFT_144627 [Galerina marginata CBS 339.88]